MSWITVRADEFCESVRDGTHDTPKQMATGYRLVTGKHIKNGQIDPSDAYYISEKDYIKINERSLVEQWDVLMSMIGTVGEVAVVKDHPNYAIKNVALFKCAGSELKGKWLAYYLRSADAQGHMSGNQKGSSQQFLSLKQLRSLPVPLADELYMQKVVDILSAYDDLIENNQKQIKLLEEAAQRLYKEWFVDLRFPGHETTPTIDGIPEGWEITSIGDIGCNIESGSRPKGGIDSSLTNGIPSIGAENVIGLGKYNYAADKFVTDEFYSSMKRGKLKNRDILVYKDGAYIGRTSLFQDGFPHKYAAVNEHVFLLHTENELLQYYLFFTLYQYEYFQKMQKLNKNAAQPGINVKAMLSLDVVVPHLSLIQKFDDFVSPIMRSIFAKAKQNRELSEARDRLLPKLMNGEIEV